MKFNKILSLTAALLLSATTAFAQTTVKIPQNGSTTYTIPDGTTSIEVTHENYGSTEGNGYLLVTAPQGYIMSVTGYFALSRWSNYSGTDYLEIYDGANTSATLLERCWNSTNNGDWNYKAQNASQKVYVTNRNIKSTGTQLYFYFHANDGGFIEAKDGGGIHLTVTLIDTRKSVKDLTINVSGQTDTGGTLTPTLTIKDGNTTLTSGTDYTVTYSNNADGTTWATPSWRRARTRRRLPSASPATN